MAIYGGNGNRTSPFVLGREDAKTSGAAYVLGLQDRGLLSRNAMRTIRGKRLSHDFGKIEKCPKNVFTCCLHGKASAFWNPPMGRSGLMTARSIAFFWAPYLPMFFSMIFPRSSFLRWVTVCTVSKGKGYSRSLPLGSGTSSACETATA